MTFVDAFGILFAVVGPPKILLAFLQDTEDLPANRRWRIAFWSTGLAAATGLVLVFAGHALVEVFHISPGALMLASGVILFVHALDLVLGRHREDSGHDPTSGTRELATAYYANPVAVAYLFLMSEATNLTSSLTLAGAFLAVIGIDLAAIAVLGIALRWVKPTYAWLMVRILGVLLAALGVDLIVDGLVALHVLGTLTS